MVRNIIHCVGKIKFIMCVRKANSDYLLCHGCHWLPPSVFPWNWISEIFTKTCLYVPILIKIRKKITDNLQEDPHILRLLWLASYNSCIGSHCSYGYYGYISYHSYQYSYGYGYAGYHCYQWSYGYYSYNGSQYSSYGCYDYSNAPLRVSLCGLL